MNEGDVVELSRRTVDIFRDCGPEETLMILAGVMVGVILETYRGSDIAIMQGLIGHAIGEGIRLGSGMRTVH